MVKAIISISERANRVLNMVKARHSLRDKSSAIEKMAEEYALHLLGLDVSEHEHLEHKCTKPVS